MEGTIYKDEEMLDAIDEKARAQGMLDNATSPNRIDEAIHRIFAADYRIAAILEERRRLKC